MGVENLAILITAAVDAACAVDALANHQTIFALFKYLGDLKALGDVSWADAKAEILDLDAKEKAQLVSLVKAKLSLHSASLEAKVEAGVDILSQAIDLAESAYALVQKAKAIVQ